MSDSEPLSHLCGAYFHQDWDLNGDRATAVLDTLAREEPAELVREIRDAAEEMARSDLTEAALESELVRFGLAYDPRLEGMSHHEWLQLVVTRLA